MEKSSRHSHWMVDQRIRRGRITRGERRVSEASGMLGRNAAAARSRYSREREFNVIGEEQSRGVLRHSRLAGPEGWSSVARAPARSSASTDSGELRSVQYESTRARSARA